MQAGENRGKTVPAEGLEDVSWEDDLTADLKPTLHVVPGLGLGVRDVPVSGNGSSLDSEGNEQGPSVYPYLSILVCV